MAPFYNLRNTGAGGGGGGSVNGSGTAPQIAFWTAADTISGNADLLALRTGTDVYGLAVRDSAANNNIFVGFGSGNNTTTGTDNVGVGQGVLVALTTGSANVVMGAAAGAAITTATDSFLLGNLSGTAITTGIGNIGIGSSSLRSTTTGTQNVSIGQNSMFDNVDGNFNVAIGNGALRDSTSDDNNIAIGTIAGRFNDGGANNVYIGNEAGRENVTGSENVFIGNQAGNGAAANSHDGIIAIGARTFEVLSTGTANTAIGTDAGAVTTTGSDLVFVGYQAGNGNTTGSSNTIVGVAAGFANTTGSDNSIFGDGAASLLNGGDNNIIIGANAASSLTTGSDNVYIGAYGGVAAIDRQVILSDGLGDVKFYGVNVEQATRQFGIGLYFMDDDISATSGSKTGVRIDSNFGASYEINPSSGTLNWSNVTIDGPSLNASGTFTGTYTSLNITTEYVDTPVGSTPIGIDFNPTTATTTAQLYGALIREGLSSFGGQSILPVSTLTTAGSFGSPTLTYSDDTTPLAVDVSMYTVLGDATTGNLTFDLPPAANAHDGTAGRIYVFKKIDSSANTVTIDADGTEEIDGLTTKVLTAQYQSVTIQTDGSNWWII